MNKEVALLKAMLNRAIAWGLLDTNPILRVKKLPEPEGRVRYLEPEEIERLLAASPPHLRPIVVCALHTGMRRGEILGLAWERVDMKNRMIRVTGTKSGKSRGIPINDPLLEELRRLPRHLKTDYVFWNHETETQLVSIKKVWATTLRKTGITNFRFHDLRHTFRQLRPDGPQRPAGDPGAARPRRPPDDTAVCRPLGRAAPRSGPGTEQAPGRWHQKWHRPGQRVEIGNRGARQLPGSIGIQVVDDAGLEPATPGM